MMMDPAVNFMAMGPNISCARKGSEMGSPLPPCSGPRAMVHGLGVAELYCGVAELDTVRPTILAVLLAQLDVGAGHRLLGCWGAGEWLEPPLRRTVASQLKVELELLL